MGQKVSRDELAELGQKLKKEGKVIVSTNGCFDILHVGHARILQESRQEGDVLVVGINSDSSVTTLKGPGRPINPEQDRAELLCALACVDYVTVFTEPTPIEFMTELKPNIHVKGADYNPEDLPENKLMKELGGKLVILPLVPGKSTTSLVGKIQNNPA